MKQESGFHGSVSGGNGLYMRRPTLRHTAEGIIAAVRKTTLECVVIIIHTY